jgi:hypothetical protein
VVEFIQRTFTVRGNFFLEVVLARVPNFPLIENHHNAYLIFTFEILNNEYTVLQNCTHFLIFSLRPAFETTLGVGGSRNLAEGATSAQKREVVVPIEDLNAALTPGTSVQFTSASTDKTLTSDF